MNKAVWAGISLTLLSAIVQAGPSEGVECKWIEANDKDNSYHLQACADGSVRVRQQDGSEILIPKEVVESLKKVDSKSRPKYADEVPCVATTPRSR